MLARIFARNRSGNFLAKAVVSLAFTLLAVFASRASLAQGLGELTLESGLNEPFRASVELLNVAGLDPNLVTIRLATPEEYEQAGLEYQSLLTAIDFATTIPASGNGVLRLSSEERITEPYISLLVSARWPAGRVMREYTVLLDLPGRGPEPASLPVSEARAASPAPASPPRSAASPAAAASATPELAGADTYTVDSGDSLWTIAERTRPSTDVPVPQMMVAIQRANEAAFVNNDINRLLSGRVLRIPDQREVARVDTAEALALVSGQSASGTTALGLPGASGGAGQDADELSVLTDDDAEIAAGSSDLEATIAALQNALLLSEEELDRARLENVELRSQLGELEEQIAILQNIIAIEDERLASLQENLAEQAEATAAARQANTEATQTLASQPAPAGDGLVGRLMTLLTNNLIALGVGLVLVLAVVAFLVQRARQSRMLDDDEDELDFDDEDDLDDDGDDDGAAGASRYFDDEAALAPAAYALDPDSDEDDPDSDEDDRDDAADDLADDDSDDNYAFHTEGDDSEAEQPWLEDSDDDADDAEETYDIQDMDDDEPEAFAQAAFAAVGSDEAETGTDPDDSGAGSVAEASGPAADEIESFEFRLDTSAGPEPELVDDAEATTASAGSLDDIETFDFKLDTPDTPQPEAPATPASDDLETISFATAAAPAAAAPAAESSSTETAGPDNDMDLADDSASLDMGNFTFDENDISFEDEPAGEEAAAYTPRTNMDECDTKLDLAVAYEAMGDVEGAVEILDEVIAEGKPNQIAEAQRLKSEWQGA